jgi:hypothetical protein
MLQAHGVAGLVRCGLAGVPDVAVAQVIGEHEAADRVARRGGRIAADLRVAAISPARPRPVAADIDLGGAAGVSGEGPGVDRRDVNINNDPRNG